MSAVVLIFYFGIFATEVLAIVFAALMLKRAWQRTVDWWETSPGWFRVIRP